MAESASDDGFTATLQQQQLRQEPQGAESRDSVPHTPTTTNANNHHNSDQLQYFSNNLLEKTSSTFMFIQSNSPSNNSDNKKGKASGTVNKHSAVAYNRYHFQDSSLGSFLTDKTYSGKGISSDNSYGNIREGSNQITIQSNGMDDRKNGGDNRRKSNSNTSYSNPPGHSSDGSLGNITSLLPDHFSQLSQTSQQNIVDQILAAHTAMTSLRVNASNNNTNTGHDSGQQGYQYLGNNNENNSSSSISGRQERSISGGGMGERVSGVGASTCTPNDYTSTPDDYIPTSSIVVSLPNHSSSLNMPESPGPQNRNE